MKKHEKPKKHKKHPPKIEKINKFNIIPTVNRYFYIPKDDIHLESGSCISSSLFINDDGEQIIEFTSFIPNGYFNLYINGVMQEGKLYMLHENYLSIKPTQATIFAGTPIIIESLGFNAKTI
jgi:hypothetical protein